MGMSLMFAVFDHESKWTSYNRDLMVVHYGKSGHHQHYVLTALMGNVNIWKIP